MFQANPRWLLLRAPRARVHVLRPTAEHQQAWLQATLALGAAAPWAGSTSPRRGSTSGPAMGPGSSPRRRGPQKSARNAAWRELFEAATRVCRRAGVLTNTRCVSACTRVGKQSVVGASADAVCSVGVRCALVLLPHMWRRMQSQTCDPFAAGDSAVAACRPRLARQARMPLLSAAAAGPAPGAHTGSASAIAAAAAKSVE